MRWDLGLEAVPNFGPLRGDRTRPGWGSGRDLGSTHEAEAWVDRGRTGGDRRSRMGRGAQLGDHGGRGDQGTDEVECRTVGTYDPILFY